MNNNTNQSFLEKTFHLSKHHTDVKTEVIAGITTFMTMAYILAVNPISSVLPVWIGEPYLPRQPWHRWLPHC